MAGDRVILDPTQDGENKRCISRRGTIVSVAKIVATSFGLESVLDTGSEGEESNSPVGVSANSGSYKKSCSNDTLGQKKGKARNSRTFTYRTLPPIVRSDQALR